MAAYHAMMRVSNEDDFRYFLSQYGETCSRSASETVCVLERAEHARRANTYTSWHVDVIALIPDKGLCDTSFSGTIADGQYEYPVTGYAFLLSDGDLSNGVRYEVASGDPWREVVAKACRSAVAP